MNIADTVAALTLEEKEALVNGDSMWTTAGVERLGVPPIKVTDGPNGARGGMLFGQGVGTLCIPCGSALGAMWDPALVAELGAAVGEETLAKGAHVLLAPTINIHRHPLGGRNFECYSEDPYLTGATAVGFIRGVQSVGVATTPKHFVGNDSEFERNTINSVIDERSLREIYLRPFEMALVEGQAWGVMSSYNRLNGTYASEHHWLLTTVLREEWGSDAMVISDWFALRSTAPSAVSGLDLEMPGPGAWLGDGKLASAVASGEVPIEAVDAMVERMLLLRERTKAADRPIPDTEDELNTPEQRDLARRAAAEAVVLLKNDDVVPLDVAGLERVAIIGPNASRAQIVGGGSASLRPYYRTSPLDAITTALPAGVEVVHERGCSIDRSAPIITGSVTVEYFDGEIEGEPAHVHEMRQARLLQFNVQDPIPQDWVARMTIDFEVPETGQYTLSVLGIGRNRVRRNGDIIAVIPEDAPRGDHFFGMGAQPVDIVMRLAAGETHTLVVESHAKGGGLGGVQVGLMPETPPDLLDRAVAAAREADAAIVVVGTNDDWETEGRDRDFFELPGEQEALIRAVAAACPKTVVAVNTGAPVAMEWIADVPAAMQIWFGGQEMSGALADILVGATDPGGRLPTTIPKDLRHAPSHLNYPGENSEVRYGEGVFVGYRGYDETDREVRFPFGHGLSTTSFDFGEPRLSAAQLVDSDELVVDVSIDVTNTGPRAGTAVVQCYVAPGQAVLARPEQELKAFQKVRLDAGESATVVLTLDRRAFAYWDPADPGFQRMRAGVPVPAGEGASHRDTPGWYVDAGSYDLRIGSSSRDIHHTVSVEIASADG